VTSLSNRLRIFNLWVDPVNLDQALELVREYIRNGLGPHSVFAVNPEKNFSILKDPILYETFKTADLLVPDGIGLVMGVRALHGISLSRVPGVELMSGICNLANTEGYKIFVYGATEWVNKTAVQILQQRYPGLAIAGRSNGYVKQDEMKTLIERINASKAEILFLALGSPNQERWYATHKGSLEGVKVCQGIGGALDTIAGNVKRAPQIWQRYSVEWLYRLLSEPRRIRRQWAVPLFGAMIICAKMKNCLILRKEKLH
jgi:N-acetylglucosaminyldiphosphoundecaprenol N-acetyl-beta-D-mannosaminyltransferase